LCQSKPLPSTTQLPHHIHFDANREPKPRAISRQYGQAKTPRKAQAAAITKGQAKAHSRGTQQASVVSLFRVERDDFERLSSQNVYYQVS
jgi:hypothetical protein